MIHQNKRTTARLFALLVAACGARAAFDGFGFAPNTAATFDVFYWLQVTNCDVLFDSQIGTALKVGKLRPSLRPYYK